MTMPLGSPGMRCHHCPHPLQPLLRMTFPPQAQQGGWAAGCFGEGVLHKYHRDLSWGSTKVVLVSGKQNQAEPGERPWEKHSRYPFCVSPKPLCSWELVLQRGTQGAPGGTVTPKADKPGKTPPVGRQQS